MSEASVVYGGFWRRTGALLIDILVGSPLFALQVLLFRASIGTAVIALLVPGVAVALYPAFFHARWGQTLGKMATKIKVVHVDGTSIGWRTALRRSSVDLILWLAYTVITAAALLRWNGPEWSSLSWVAQQNALQDESVMYGTYTWLSQLWGWSEIVVLLFNRKRRALHDFIAHTVVVRAVEPSAELVPLIDPGRPANA